MPDGLAQTALRANLAVSSREKTLRKTLELASFDTGMAIPSTIRSAESGLRSASETWNYFRCIVSRETAFVECTPHVYSKILCAVRMLNV